MKQAPLIIFLLLWLPLSDFAQGNFKLHKMAVSAARDKNWEVASNHYRKLYKRDSSNLRVTYAYADVCRENMETHTAIYLYERLLKQAPRKYPLAAYHIAQLQKQLMNYKEAGKWFARFNRTPVKKEYETYKISARREMEACELAAIRMKEPLPIVLKKADSLVNALYSEYAPFRRGNTLYYSTLQHGSRVSENEHPKSRIMVVDLQGGKKSKPKTLDTTINATTLHNANTSIDASGKRMVFSRCRNLNANDYSCKLYQSVFVNNKWQNASPLNDSINLPGSSSTQPSFAKWNGKELLLFCSNRMTGEGAYDIWCAEASADGNFESVRPLDPALNSPGNELSPFYDEKEQKLYFSSDGFSGFGSYDVFYSRYNGKSFEAPQNAGFPINSGYNDLYFSIDRESGTAWLASNRLGANAEKKSSCCNDIYTYDLPKVTQAPKVDSLHLSREKLKLLVPLTLYFHNDEPEPRTELTSSTKTYPETYEAYRALLPIYMKSFSTGYKAEEKAKAEALVASFFSDSLQAGYEDLQKFTKLLQELLQRGQRVQITLKGFCSPLASTAYNQKLAKRRISSLRNYFDQYEEASLQAYCRTREGKAAQLEFIEEDIGELPNSKASDDFKDKQKSIYSPYAAAERKIQIIALSFGE